MYFDSLWLVWCFKTLTNKGRKHQYNERCKKKNKINSSVYSKLFPPLWMLQMLEATIKLCKSCLVRQNTLNTHPMDIYWPARIFLFCCSNPLESKAKQCVFGLTFQLCLQVPLKPRLVSCTDLVHVCGAWKACIYEVPVQSVASESYALQPWRKTNPKDPWYPEDLWWSIMVKKSETCQCHGRVVELQFICENVSFKVIWPDFTHV